MRTVPPPPPPPLPPRFGRPPSQPISRRVEELSAMRGSPDKPPAPARSPLSPAREHHLREVVSGLVSMVVHLILAILLALWSIVVGSGTQDVDVTAAWETSVDLLEELDVPTVVVAPAGDDLGIDASDLPAEPVEEAGFIEFDEMFASLDLSDFNATSFELRQPAVEDLLRHAGIAEAKGRSVVDEARGALRQSTSPEEVVSGLGGDIARRLARGNVLVVWVFDASLSMAEDRRLASQQMKRVFRELDDRTRECNYRHHESIIRFGNGFERLVPPTRHWENVVKAAGSIVDDVSGIERLFATLQVAIPHYRKEWEGQLLFVVWTDESGDDVDGLESVIELCKQHKAEVSVVGPTAVLGRRRGYQFFRWSPQYFWHLPVDRGPDSGIPQALQHPFWFTSYATNSHPSGFGPYALVRLSQATGGSFTLYDRLADRSQYRLEDLAAYQPDDRDAATLHHEAFASPFRRAIVKAAEATQASGLRGPPRTEIDCKYWLSPAEFRARLERMLREDLAYVRIAKSEAQRAYDLLRDGGVEHSLRYETSPRWQANYLLARGRAAILLVRHREYELFVEQVFANKVLDPNTNKATLTSSHRRRSGAWGEQLLDEARKWLGRCVEEHPGTPWAALARAELNTPVGVTILQRRTILIPGPAPPPGPPPPRL